MTIPLQRGKSVRVSPSSCSQLLIRPRPLSGLGRALSRIHNHYNYGVDYDYDYGYDYVPSSSFVLVLALVLVEL